MTENASYPFDLVVLVPDKNMEAAVRGMLSRPRALGIREIKYDTFIHIERDPGCLNRGHDFLRPMVKKYQHALVMLDRQGCGQEHLPREVLEKMVRDNLQQSGWGERADSVVLDPELEVWLWSESPQVASCLGWPSDTKNLRDWLKAKGLWDYDSLKPADPKAATERVLREVRKPRSSAMYAEVARQVSLKRCTDSAFRKFKELLQSWFGR